MTKAKVANRFPLPDADKDGVADYVDADKTTNGFGLDLNGDGIADVVFYEGFSPNGDNINDIWEIDGILNFTTNIVRIFNRWGQVVFEV